MPKKSFYNPGDPVPETGDYSLLNVFGSATGDIVTLQKAGTFGPAPRGFHRQAAEEAKPEPEIRFD